MRQPTPDPAVLVELANARMPFGKYKGRRLVSLPEPYLVWFKNRGFPPGKLGRYMQQALDLKTYGLEHLLDPLRDTEPVSPPALPPFPHGDPERFD